MSGSFSPFARYDFIKLFPERITVGHRPKKPPLKRPVAATATVRHERRGRGRKTEEQERKHVLLLMLINVMQMFYATL